MSSTHSAFPTLQPAFVFKLNIGEQNPIGEIFSGSTCVHVATSTGSIKSVEGFEPKVDAQIVSGGDWLYFDADKKHARINVEGVAKTTEGTAFKFSYAGVIAINEGVKTIFEGRPESCTIPFGQGTTTHTMQVGDPKLKVLENCTFVGNGRFVVEDGKVTAESRVSKVVASTEMD
ncbi:MAG: hypothetical protein M1816_000515 [Peltula sp. TS41687]|nr:MAG: hypothetical protein M1816_000515 [Peltula sp. TS41687]